MEGLGVGMGTGIAIGMGSGIAVGVAFGLASARKQLKKQLSGLLRAGEIRVTDKNQSPIDAELFVEMALLEKRTR